MRHPTLSDAESIYEYASDPEVTQYMDWATHKCVETVVDFLRGCIDRLGSGSELSWAMTLPPTDRAIGMISCRMKGDAVDFGYVLNRNYWHRGLGTEAATAIVQWASNLDHVYRVWATCDAENVASARVLEKAGLAREGILRRWVVRPNIGPEPRDAFIYARVPTTA